MQHVQKFESSIIQYCAGRADRALKLIEDDEITPGIDYLAHLHDVLQALNNARTNQGYVNINDFAKIVSTFEDNEKDDVYTHFQEHGFGQYIPE